MEVVVSHIPANPEPSSDEPEIAAPVGPALPTGTALSRAQFEAEPLNLRLLAQRPALLALLRTYLKLDGQLKNGAVVDIPRRVMLSTRNLLRYLDGETDAP
jgi:hypothetical protein